MSALVVWALHKPGRSRGTVLLARLHSTSNLLEFLRVLCHGSDCAARGFSQSYKESFTRWCVQTLQHQAPKPLFAYSFHGPLCSTGSSLHQPNATPPASHANACRSLTYSVYSPWLCGTAASVYCARNSGSCIEKLLSAV